MFPCSPKPREVLSNHVKPLQNTGGGEGGENELPLSCSKQVALRLHDVRLTFRS